MAVDELSATFAALADATRRAILARLTDGEATVNELAEPFRSPYRPCRSTLGAGACRADRAGRTAQRRPLRLRADKLEDVVEWLDTAGSGRAASIA
jgi:DNA-binding transcriptional ArsR family regulator